MNSAPGCQIKEEAFYLASLCHSKTLKCSCSEQRMMTALMITRPHVMPLSTVIEVLDLLCAFTLSTQLVLLHLKRSTLCGVQHLAMQVCVRTCCFHIIINSSGLPAV